MIIDIPNNHFTLPAVMKMLCGLFPDYADELTNLLLNSKKGVSLEITALKKHQTITQKGYYWANLRRMAKDIGMTPDELHNEMLCEAFGSDEVATPFGIKRRPHIRSSECDRDKYSDLIETMIRVADSIGYLIPISRQEEEMEERYGRL